MINNSLFLNKIFLNIINFILSYNFFMLIVENVLTSRNYIDSIILVKL